MLDIKMTGAGTETPLEAGAADEWLTPGRFALFLGLLILAAFPGVLLGGTTFIIRMPLGGPGEPA